MQIIPTVLEKDFVKAEERIRLIKDSSQWIQVDVTDNVFTEGKSFELELISKIDFNTDNVLWDIHLMVKEPIDWVNKCAFVGANRIIGQVEMMQNRELFIKTVKDGGWEAGLAFDIASIINDIPEETDVVILMGRKAGFETREFDEGVFEKIKSLQQIKHTREKKFLIAVDGGVNFNNLNKLNEVGVDVIYSGNSYLELMNDKNY
jgi:ribulose-phosphate 3-epimerase